MENNVYVSVYQFLEIWKEKESEKKPTGSDSNEVPIEIH